MSVEMLLIRLQYGFSYFNRQYSFMFYNPEPKVLCCPITAFCYHIALYYTKTHLSYPSTEIEIYVH